MIKSFKKFNESISGTELIGPMGPNYGDTTLPHKPNSKYTDVVYSEIFGRVVTQDEYQGLYQEYLKRGGKPLHDFNSENLELVLSKINENTENTSEDIQDYFIELVDNGNRVEFVSDFDGYGTDCIELEIIEDIIDEEWAQFIYDLYQISKELQNKLELIYLYPKRREFKNKPLIDKIDITKYSEITNNQFKRLENANGLVICDITHELSGSPGMPETNHLYRIKFGEKTRIKRKRINESKRNIHDEISDLFQDVIDDGISVEYNDQSTTYDSITLNWIGNWKKFNISQETKDLMRGLVSASNTRWRRTPGWSEGDLRGHHNVEKELYGIAKKQLNRLKDIYDIRYFTIAYDNGYNDEDDEVKIWGPDPGYIEITFSKINI